MGTPSKYPIKIHVCEPDVSDLEIRYVTEAVRENMISSIAPPVGRFEEAFARRFGVRHAISVNSGGSALFLALKALGIGPGDEVIVPSFTMIATAAAVSHCGARPVFIDSCTDDPNINPAKIEARITPRTKAIVPVHIYGQPCNMDAVMAIAKLYALHVVEDAAESHGALYKNQLTGTIGTAGCFSFYANKIMTSGEGGMITTNDDDLADRLRHIRGYDFDNDRHFWHKTISWNLRLSALGAALGLAQLERLDEFVEKRRAHANYYTEHLKDISELVFFPERPGTFSVSWMYGILAPGRRDALMQHLFERGIETRTFFIPMHQQPVYKQNGDYKNAERFGNDGLYLPSASSLTREAQDTVIEAVREFYGK